MIKKIFFSLLLALSIVSCNNSNQNIEGFWIDSYYQFLETEKDTVKRHSIIRQIIKIKGDKIRVKRFENKEFSIPAIDTTLNFTLKDNKIYINDEDASVWEVLVFKDRMTITYDNNIKTTFKKLPTTSKKVNWNPEGKLYKSTVGNQVSYEDYTDSTNMYFFFTNTVDVLKYDWKIEHVDNYSFLLLESFFGSKPLFVDSIEGNKIHLTDYTLDGNKYILEQEKTIQKAPTELFGIWKLTNRDDIDDKEDFNPLSQNTIKQIIIRKDSILFLNDFFKQRSAWKYYKDGNFILLKDKVKMARISVLGTHSLVLEMNLTTMEDSYEKKKFIFIRE
ncbi:hypothetical protein [Kordia sp.]|uniref:hypothetical protein n=1 Tax=Kordia sp. TaxID=1965332 RepID=UPI003B5C88A6